MKLTSSIKSALDRAFSPECDMSTPLTPYERVCGGLALLGPILGLLLLGSLVGGCKAFYEHAGSHTRVGSLTAPVEVSDPSDALVVRALYAMDGADVYTAKDSLVKIRYTNAYTNNYFAIVKTQGLQDLEVEIEPLDCSGGATNDVTAVSNSDK